MHGNTQLAALLLRFGADPNLICGEHYLMTPLHLAVRRDRFGSDELVALLLTYGANPLIKTVSGSKYGGDLTAIDFSYMNEYSLSSQPMTETLARYAGGPKEQFFCKSVLTLYRETMAWCAKHKIDDGFWNEQKSAYKAPMTGLKKYVTDSDPTRIIPGRSHNGPLLAVYTKACKHCPPYHNKIVALSMATYENGKELVDKLSWAQLILKGAKVSGGRSCVVMWQK